MPADERSDLQTLLMQSPTLACIQRGRELVYEFANPAYQQLAGGRLVVGKPMREVFPELEGQGVFEQLQRVYETGVPFTVEEFPARLDRAGSGVLEEGFYRYVVQPLRDADGRIVGLAHFGVEITEQVQARRRAEALAERLRVSEHKFSLMFERAPFALAMVRASDDVLTDVNQAWVELFGFSKEQAIGKNSVALGLYPDTEERRRLFAEFERTGSVREFETTVISKDGAPHRISNSMDRIELGGEVFVLGSIKDVTAQRYAEEALYASEEQFHTLADSIPQLAWIAEADGAIHWYNRRWYEYTGTTAGQMMDESGWGWKRVHDPAELPRVLARFKAALESGEQWEDTFPLRRHDGVFRAHLSRAMPGEDAKGRVIRWFGTNTDIEEQRLQAAALREALEVRDTFLQVAAHELRTPLTSLLLRLQVIERQAETAANAELKRNLELGEAQVRKLNALVNALLDVTRISSGKVTLEREPLDLSALAREVAARLEADAARAGCRLEVNAPGAIHGAWDRLRIDQVLTNLLSNAFKYGAGKPIRVEVTSDEQHARISVRDEGIGISPAVLPRIYEKFARGVSEQHYGGMGLGLYISRTLVEAMRGTIRVETAPEQGATFIVELPRRVAAS